MFRPVTFGWVCVFGISPLVCPVLLALYPFVFCRQLFCSSAPDPIMCILVLPLFCRHCFGSPNFCRFFRLIFCAFVLHTVCICVLLWCVSEVIPLCCAFLTHHLGMCYAFVLHFSVASWAKSIGSLSRPNIFAFVWHLLYICLANPIFSLFRPNIFAFVLHLFGKPNFFAFPTQYICIFFAFVLHLFWQIQFFRFSDPIYLHLFCICLASLFASLFQVHFYCFSSPLVIALVIA